MLDGRCERGTPVIEGKSLYLIGHRRTFAQPTHQKMRIFPRMEGIVQNEQF